MSKRYELDVASGVVTPYKKYGDEYCSTCVQMTQDNQSMEQENILLRRRNKTLVTVNRVLRDRCTELQTESDTLIQELYSFDKELDQVALDDQLDLAFE